MPNRKVDAWMVTAVRCLVEKEKHREQHQEEYADTYGRIDETARMKLIRNVKDHVKHRSLQVIRVEEDKLDNGERKRL